MMAEYTQDYTNPLFVENERDKIAHEIVSGFRLVLELLPSNSKSCLFLREKGLYIGPYSDTPADKKDEFLKVAKSTHSPDAGPKLNVTIDGSISPHVPGMLKHAWNSGAARVNGQIAGQSNDEIERYEVAAKGLERTAWAVSRAIADGDLEAALEAVYGDEYKTFSPHPTGDASPAQK